MSLRIWPQAGIAHFQTFRNLGYRTILNLRRPDEGSDEEAVQVRALGMNYVNIPIRGATIAPDQLGEFTAALTDSVNYPMLVHCASANRVGAMFYLHRVIHEKAENATARCRKGGQSA